MKYFIAERIISHFVPNVCKFTVNIRPAFGGKLLFPRHPFSYLWKYSRSSSGCFLILASSSTFVKGVSAIPAAARTALQS